jgi:polysaccharide export outer membrane protein
MTIIQAVTLAGGLTPRSASNRTIVTRIIEGKEYQVVVPVKDIGEGKKKNFLLIPGDIVFVPDALF